MRVPGSSLGGRTLSLVAAAIVLASAVAGVVIGTASPASASTVCASGATLDGIDVSTYQGAIDWAQVKAAGITFAFAKATDGSSLTDSRFAANFAAMKASGVTRGAYLFFRASADPTAQADLFLSTLQQNGYGPGDLPPAIDVETTDGQSAPTTVSRLRQLVSIVHDAIGAAPLIYTTASFWNTTLGGPTDFASSGLWVANWGPPCPAIPNPTWSSWSFWQRSSTGTVAGISGPVDLDRFNGSTLPAFAGAAPRFSDASPPVGALPATPYAYTFRATGFPSPTFAVASGALPAGLALDPMTGALTGSPTATGSSTFTIDASNGIAPAASTPPITITVAASDTFHPLSPVRVLDSRPAGPQVGPYGTPWGAGQTRDVTVAGVAGVPADADAVVLNVTVTDTTASSYLSLWPSGESRPLVSSLNWTPGQTTPNAVTVKAGTSGNISIYNLTGSVDVIADIVGYYDQGPGDGYNSLSPSRILDSRPAGPQVGPYGTPWGAGQTRDVTVAGVAGVPADAEAVVLNVTVTDTTASSYLSLWPAGESRPLVSSLNWTPGQTTPNAVTVKAGTSGKVSIYNLTGSVDVIADIVGYFTAGSGSLFHPLPPSRIQDSRPGSQVASYSTPWGPGTTRSVQVAGEGGPLPTAQAVLLNVTVTDTTASSYLSLWPAGESRPLVSSLNWTPGQTTPNAVTVKVGASGNISIYNLTGNVDVIADLSGWYG